MASGDPIFHHVSLHKHLCEFSPFQDIINSLSLANNDPVQVLAAFGTIGGALFGFDISSMSAWLGTEQYTNYFNNPSADLQGGITASMSAGSFVGAIAAGFLADRWGRKIALQIACIIFIIGSAIVCSSQNVGQLIAGRIVNGLSIGICSSQVCVYLAELAPSQIRGRIVGIQQWSIEWGILIMYLICYGCASTIEGPAAFRISWGVQGIPAIVLFGALFFFPESPRFLASKERWDECLSVLADLHGNGNASDPVVQAEYEEVKEAQRIMAEAKGVGFFELFGPKVWKRTMCGTTVQMWQQLLGGNVAMYYVVYVSSPFVDSARQSLTSLCADLPNGRPERKHQSLLLCNSIRDLPRYDGSHATIHRSFRSSPASPRWSAHLHDPPLYHSWCHGDIWKTGRFSFRKRQLEVGTHRRARKSRHRSFIHLHRYIRSYLGSHGLDLLQ